MAGRVWADSVVGLRWPGGLACCGRVIGLRWPGGCHVACGGRRVCEGFVACGGRRRAGVRRYTRRRYTRRRAGAQQTMGFACHDAPGAPQRTSIYKATGRGTPQEGEASCYGRRARWSCGWCGGLRWPGGCDWPAVAGRVSRGLRWPARARGLCGLRWPAAGATIYKATIYKATGRQSNGAPSEQRRAPSRRWGLLATMPRAHRSARRYTRRRAEGLPKGRQAATEGEPGGRAGGVVACGGRTAVIGLRWPGGCHVACGGRRVREG